MKKLSKREKELFAAGCKVGARNSKKKTSRTSYRKRTSRNYY